MSQLDLFFDLTNKTLVKSSEDTSNFLLPPLHQEDQVAIALRAYKRISYFAAPYFEAVSLSGYSMTISVGVAGNAYATQATWTLDATGYVLTGVLDLNTVEVGALADGTAMIFEIILSDATSKYRMLATATYKKSVVLAGASLPVTMGTALSKEEATALYLPKVSIRSFIMTDNDGKNFLIRVQNKTLRCEELQ